MRGFFLEFYDSAISRSLKPPQRPTQSTLKTEYGLKNITMSEPQHQVKRAEDKPTAMTTWENNDTSVRLGHTPRDGSPIIMGRGRDVYDSEDHGA